MDAPLIAAAFAAGLTGSVHCAAMCGGLVASMAWQPRPQAPTIAIRAEAPPVAGQLALHTGRLATYSLMGAAMGSVSAAGIAISGLFPLREALYLLAQFWMILLGVHLSGFAQPLKPLEDWGAAVWRRFRPARLPLAGGLPGRFVTGAVWGWLPCGMVYSMLFSALTAGSTASGALVMLAFGAGTLPLMVTLGTAAQRTRLQSPAARWLAASVVAAFGVWGLIRAPGMEAWSVLGSFCVGRPL